MTKIRKTAAELRYMHQQYGMDYKNDALYMDLIEGEIEYKGKLGEIPNREVSVNNTPVFECPWLIRVHVRCLPLEVSSTPEQVKIIQENFDTYHDYYELIFKHVAVAPLASARFAAGEIARSFIDQGTSLLQMIAVITPYTPTERDLIDNEPVIFQATNNLAIDFWTVPNTKLNRQLAVHKYTSSNPYSDKGDYRDLNKVDQQYRSNTATPQLGLTAKPKPRKVKKQKGHADGR